MCCIIVTELTSIFVYQLTVHDASPMIYYFQIIICSDMQLQQRQPVKFMLPQIPY
jgi:hypothetical protein